MGVVKRRRHWTCTLKCCLPVVVAVESGKSAGAPVGCWRATGRTASAV